MADSNHRYPSEPFGMQLPSKDDVLKFHAGPDGPGMKEVDSSWGGDMVYNVHGSVKWTDKPFVVHAPFDVSGDQQQAIDRLAEGVLEGDRFQTLKGVTGSG
ncbi:MAG: hypothetical protein IJJ95_03540, partial [Spirochaetales bacterium]|nr:hypothetical protein [Spirochaetales bacterium]